MIVTCRNCEVEFDDAERNTICPHHLLMPKVDMARKDVALRLLGRDVRFRDQPHGPYRRIDSVGWKGMVTVAGMSGEFAPHLFVVKEDDGQLRPHLGTHPLTETTCDFEGCWCQAEGQR